jgi:hypothetical protein
MTYHDRIARMERLLKDFNKKICCLQSEIDEGGGGEPFALFTENSPTVTLSGAGTEADPLIADALEAPIQNGIISGGEVTWIEDYTYSVSPAVYYINGIQYQSPYTEITLDPADPVLNRIDVFALTTSNTAVAITGVPSTNPEQPSINTGTQIITSFALVVAGTTEPTPAVAQDYIYRENVGVPTEWNATGSATIVVNSVTLPYAGTIDINGTAVTAGATLTFVDSAASAIAATKNVLIFYIRSKATWNNNRRLNFQFRNGVTNVGLSVPFGNGLFGFDSAITASYQRIVIPFSAFAILASDNIDTLLVTASGTGGTMGFYMDDVELQGANLIAPAAATTDNVGVFHVSKNYSGVGNAVFSSSNFTIAGITSVNTGYMTQLSAARMGDANKAYPDPWAARNAAMTALTSGAIKRALVVMESANYWTYGSNTLAQNGDSTGNSAVNEIPDVRLAGNGDISSLMKNNIDYYWQPNSGLTSIAKSFAFHVGYNSDPTDVLWKSGFYGHGNFTTIYGTLEGLSQRFVEINNARAEFTFECNKAVIQRAWIFLHNYKSANIKVKRWFGGLWDSFIYENGTSREGDGLPAVLHASVDEAFMGPSYFPYTPSYTAGVGTRAFWQANYGTAARLKVRSVNVGKLFMDVTGNGCLITGGGTTASNNQSELNIGYLRHRYNLVSATNTGALVLITSQSASQTGSNNSFIFNIKEADIEAPFIEPRNGLSGNAANVNNKVIINMDDMRFRNPVTALTAAFAFPMSNVAIAGEKPTYIFNIKKCLAVEGYCFDWNANTGAGWAYNGHVIVNGVYKTLQALPPIYLRHGTNPSAFLDGVKLISGGTYSIDGDAVGRQIFAKDVLSNVPVNGTNITATGTLTTEPLITNYL